MMVAQELNNRKTIPDHLAIAVLICNQCRQLSSREILFAKLFKLIRVERHNLMFEIYIEVSEYQPETQ